MKRLRSMLPTPSMTVALLALVVALGGTATAASVLITSSKQVKAGSISLSDLSKSAQKALKGKAGPAGAAGPVGAAGAAGSAGAAGAAGATGARGASAWDTIPSGQTVTGAIEFDTTATVNGDFRHAIPLPAQASANLSNATVNFAADASAATTDDDATCTGTSMAPTAPSGKVCVYLINTASDTSSLFARDTLQAPRSGFTIVWTDTATSSSDVFVYATWAYTAP